MVDRKHFLYYTSHERLFKTNHIVNNCQFEYYLSIKHKLTTFIWYLLEKILE